MHTTSLRKVGGSVMLIVEPQARPRYTLDERSPNAAPRRSLRRKIAYGSTLRP